MGQNMEDVFRGSQPLTDGEVNSLWKTAVFSFDANILLNLYRFKVETRDALLDALEILASQKRLWLTYQALLEFHRHRVKVIREEAERADKIVARFAQFIGSLNDLVSRGYHPNLDLTAFRKIAREARDEAKTLKDAAGNVPVVDPLRDDTLKRLQAIVSNSFGPQPTEEECLLLVETALKRYREEIPPGFKDEPKLDGGVGDYLVWQELVSTAKRQGRGLVFVTDDTKADWWLSQKQGMTEMVSVPHPALIDEMYHEAQQRYYQYTSTTFLSHAKEKLGATVSDEAVEDARSLEEARAQEQTLKPGGSALEYWPQFGAAMEGSVLAGRAIQQLVDQDTQMRRAIYQALEPTIQIVEESQKAMRMVAGLGLDLGATPAAIAVDQMNANLIDAATGGLTDAIVRASGGYLSTKLAKESLAGLIDNAMGPSTHDLGIDPKNDQY